MDSKLGQRAKREPKFKGISPDPKLGQGIKNVLQFFHGAFSLMPLNDSIFTKKL